MPCGAGPVVYEGYFQARLGPNWEKHWAAGLPRVVTSRWQLAANSLHLIESIFTTVQPLQEQCSRHSLECCVINIVTNLTVCRKKRSLPITRSLRVQILENIAKSTRIYSRKIV